MLNKREINILESLLNEEFLKIDDFNISKRALQYNLKNINFYLTKYGFDKITTNKNNILYSNKENIKIFLEKISKSYEISKEDRKLIILLYSSLNITGLNITYLSGKLNVSRNTIKTTMNEVDLDFNYVQKKGYFVEIDIYQLVELLEKIRQNEYLLSFIDDVIDKNMYSNVQNFLIEITNTIAINLNDEMHRKIIDYIYCLIHLNKADTNKKFNFVEESKLIEKIYFKYFDNKNVVNIVCDTIIGMSLTPKLESWLNESYLIKKLIKNVSILTNIDMTEDTILFDFLISHIKVSIYRLKKNINLTNPVYQTLIWQNDPIINIIKKAIVEIENVYDIKFNDTEISLIGYHFKASIERIKINKRKKVILVCGLGYGTSRVLENDLKDKFDIDIIDVIPAYMLNENLLNKLNYDYILTTIDLNIESIKINPLLKSNDYEKLLSLGFTMKKDKIFVDDFLEEINEFGQFDNEKLKNHLLNKFSNIFSKKYKDKNILSKLLDEKRVIFKDKVDSFNEAIHIIGDNLVKLGSTNSNYTYEMINMTKKYGSYIVIDKNIAIPHAKSEKNIYKTDFSILILENPVFLNDKSIQVFFCFASTDEKSHLDALSSFYELILRPNFIDDILKIKTYDEFIRYIEQE